MRPTQTSAPAISVIVPVHNGEQFLPASLAALRASDLPAGQWELIVVDDSSQDRSADVAIGFADRVIRMTDGPRGPAAARNRGASVAAGEMLVFIDADVCVHEATLGRIVETFTLRPEVSAVFGAYDLHPSASGLVSQYRNLLHRYVHERDAGEAVTFWAGCGAVRTNIFSGCGGFDETPKIRAIEDIELGYRISAQGHRIILCPEIQGRHLKRWTLWSMIVTDVRYRGIPWTRLLIRRHNPPVLSLSIRSSERACTLLMGIGLLALGLWQWTGRTSWLPIASLAFIATLVLNTPLLAWFARHRGWRFAAGTVPLRLLYYALNVVSILIALLSPGYQRRHALLFSKTIG